MCVRGEAVSETVEDSFRPNARSAGGTTDASDPVSYQPRPSRGAGAESARPVWVGETRLGIDPVDQFRVERAKRRTRALPNWKFGNSNPNIVPANLHECS